MTSLYSSIIGQPFRVPGSRTQVVTYQFTRPAKATAYAANDVVSDDEAVAKTLAVAFPFQNGLIVGASMAVSATSLIAADYDLLIGDNEIELLSHTDNAALALVAGDIPNVAGIIQFPNAAKRNITAGGALLTDLYVPNNALAAGSGTPLAIPIASKTLFSALLVTRSAFTLNAAITYTMRFAIQGG